MLYPDYTDEEIRREVRNFGVKRLEDGNLELEEKGAIYTEMMSSSSQPGYRAYRAMGRLLYGGEHPVSFDSGGDPAYIREMKADHIRRFHASNYHLANMEMITSLPKGLPLTEALARFDDILNQLQGTKPIRPGAKWSDLPQPRPAAEGGIEIVEFPSTNPQQPGPAQIAWPVMPRLNPRDEGLAELFAQAAGGDPSTNLYKLFIDSKTRKMDIGARSIAIGFDNEAFAGFMIYIPDLAASQATPERLKEIYALVKSELERIAGWPDESAELLAFHERMQANLLRMRRSGDKLISSPPGFGDRMGYSIWPSLLRDLNDEPGFEKSLVQTDLFAYLESVVKSGKNIWRDKIGEWKLLSKTPYSVAARASGKLIEQEDADYKRRIAAEVERLKRQYEVTDEQEAIRRYQQEYNAASAELDRVQSMDTPAKFIEHPPMTLDDQLDYTVKHLAGGIPLVIGRFSGMSSATVGLALDARELKGRQLLYAAILPQLLSGMGMTKDGETLSYEDAMQRMRREILGVGSGYSTNAATGRLELVLSGAGNTLEEALAAIGWMKATLYAPNWSIANLNRFKDLVDQSINALRGTMQRSEENWVNGPANAWTYQDDPLLLSVSSFHTSLLHLHRLRWLLADTPDTADREAIAGFLREIESLPLPIGKETLDSIIAKLKDTAQPLANEAAKDLLFIENELPANSRDADWNYLVRVTREDFLAPADQAIAELEELRKTLLKKANARLHLTASPENASAIEPLLDDLTSGLSDDKPSIPGPMLPRAIARRVMAREELKTEPTFVGLLAPNMQGGVHLHSIRSVGIRDLDENSALDFLAFKVFGGAGPHGVFMKTWSAGLAYSNGLRSSAAEGRSSYYAERTPELPQTLKFVINELKTAPRTQALAEYTLAQVFAGTRAGSSFESRTSAMASDLADGWPPSVIRDFRANILKLRSKPDLDQQLYNRMDAVYAKVLPGYDGKLPQSPNSTYFVIGPEKQLDAWEKYLKLSQGEDAKLYRLVARDYWVIVE